MHRNSDQTRKGVAASAPLKSNLPLLAAMLCIVSMIGATLAIAVLPDQAIPGQQSRTDSPGSGHAPASGNKPPAENPQVPVTVHRLPIDLRATFSDEQGGGTALIEYQGISKRLSRGETLPVPDTAILLEVWTDHVLIQRQLDGRTVAERHYLKFHGSRLADGSSASDSEKDSSKKPVSVVNSRSEAIRRLVGDQFTHTLQQQPMRFARFVFIAPDISPRGDYALTLHAGPDRRLFSELGLQSGDRLLAVNREPVVTLSRERLQSMAVESKEFELTIERAGVPHSMLVVM